MAITQKSRIQIRRGKIDELPQLASGELGWAIDTQQVFIGNGTPAEGAPIVGNTEILTSRSSIVRNPISNTILIEVSDQTSHTFNNGDPVYFTGTEWTLASAFTESTYATGVITGVEGPIFKVVLYGRAEIGSLPVNGGTEAPVAGQFYYTSADELTPGEYVTVPPDNKNLVLYALSNAEVIVAPGLPTSANQYNRAAPMEISVGGALVGSTFSGTIQAALDKILYPYIEPQFQSFSADFLAAPPYEVGRAITTGTSYQFNWTISSPQNVDTNTVFISDVTSETGTGTQPAFSPVNLNTTDLTNGFTTIAFERAVQRTTAGTYTWRISGDGLESGAFSRDFTVEWQWRVFYGSTVDVLTELNENEIEAFTNDLRSTPNTTYSFTTPGYKYIAYPKDQFGTRSLFFDVSQGLGVAMEAPFEILITNAYGISAWYYVYRTTNQLAGNINIEIRG